ncbi:MAG: hypothetical protein M0D53_09355 [Flavobacterium sp. JAD_PAG50586_2]|nr:MAG: hypothetical protein M0D53_09355 [Flavobacterium sp. JAD_PAG50586_2]
MNERIKKLFVCVHENKVIAFETNLKAFHTLFIAIEPEASSYAWLRRHFIKEKTIVVHHNGKDYTLQQLV